MRNIMYHRTGSRARKQDREPRVLRRKVLKDKNQIIVDLGVGVGSWGIVQPRPGPSDLASLACGHTGSIIPFSINVFIMSFCHRHAA